MAFATDTIILRFRRLGELLLQMQDEIDGLQRELNIQANAGPYKRLRDSLELASTQAASACQILQDASTLIFPPLRKLPPDHVGEVVTLRPRDQR
jgi:hypothetical protein